MIYIAQAALIGSKVDVVSPDKGYRRRPRSAYAQAKVRQMASDKRHLVCVAFI